MRPNCNNRVKYNTIQHKQSAVTDRFSVSLSLFLGLKFGIFGHHLLAPLLKEVSRIRVELQTVLAILTGDTLKSKANHHISYSPLTTADITTN